MNYITLHEEPEFIPLKYVDLVLDYLAMDHETKRAEKHFKLLYKHILYNMYQEGQRKVTAEELTAEASKMIHNHYIDLCIQDGYLEESIDDSGNIVREITDIGKQLSEKLDENDSEE